MITEPTPQYEFFGSCARGTEGLLAAELTSLGAQRVRPLQAGVAFFGTLEAGYRACLWSRIASRVLLVLGRVAALDADELYASVLEIDWESHIDPARTIAVSARGGNAALVDTMFIALKVKDALCDRLREKCGIRPSVEKDRPDVRIDVLVHNKRATVSIDLAGEPLHMRGYRVPSRHIIAPVRETIAATMLLAAGWGMDKTAENHKKASGYELLLDPLCGSGTIVIEAALIALDRAPGALRDYWGFTGWLGHDEDLWVDLLDEADNRAEFAHEQFSSSSEASSVASSASTILASDIDPIAVEVARASARRAGVEFAISFSVADVNDAGALISAHSKAPDSGHEDSVHDETSISQHDTSSPGTFGNASTSAPGVDRRLVVTNPPYAHRLSTLSQLPPLYAALRALIDPALTETPCDLCVITADEGMEAYLGQAPIQRIATFNGA
ncbi:MAG: THUMP domain-containing protein, partial [Coriobacteriia bacterium]|nr:THUMP domain-containing protein [Coriobacteriia bacterium]